MAKLGSLTLVASLTFGVLTVSGTASGASVKAQLMTKTLSLSDLPTGWSVDDSSRNSGATTVSCLSGLKSSFTHGVKVTVAFRSGTTIPTMQETIETGPGVAARYRAFVRILSGCKSISFTSNGQNFTGTVGAMSFPRLGNQSSASSIVLMDQGIRAGMDIILFRVADDIGEVFYEDLGTPNANQVQSLATMAVAKIQGATRGRTSSGSQG